MATPSDTQPAERGRRAWYHSIQPTVFWPSAVIILGFVLATVIWPEQMNTGLGEIDAWIVEIFGSYYTLIVTAFVVFALYVGLGHYGDIKLGKDDDDPEFNVFSWITMLFAAGMGIGLVFFGVAEPLQHYAGMPNRSAGAPSGMTDEGGEESLVQTFLHWGLHPWAIYVAIGLAIAYAVHRKGRPISIRWTLQPLFGNRVKGWVGDVIDIAAVVGTLFGVATSLGLGVLQIAGGLTFLDIVQDPGNVTYVILIGGITLLAIGSVVSGVGKGIKWLSNINMSIAGILLLLVIILGPTLFIARDVVQSAGSYFQNLIQYSFDTTALEGNEGTDWQGFWKAFYWGWWMSWAPFVGVFIARISRGRTVRQFVAAVLLVPTTVSFIWFTGWGGAALDQEKVEPGSIVDAVDEDGEVIEGARVAMGADGGPRLDDVGNYVFIGPDGSEITGATPSVNDDTAFFQLLEFDQYLGGPESGGTTILIGVAVILIVLFFVTSSDSGSLVIDMLSSGGTQEPPKWSRVFWATLEGAVAAALLIAGDEDALSALRSAAIIIALPFSIVLILLCWATLKEFRRERTIALRIQRRQQRDELTEHVSQNLIDEGLVDPNGADGGSTGGTSGSSTPRS